MRRIIAIVILSALVLLTLLAGLAIVAGGGIGKKRIGLSGELHTSEPLIMAHRGVWRGQYPHNSWAALNAARESGFKAVEIDVKRSADGHFYLFHDRTSTALGVDIDLNTQSLEELQRYALHYNGQPTSQRILSLEDFAAEFTEDFVVYLHIKRHGNNDLQKLSAEIATFIERHDLQQRSIVGGDFVFITWFEYHYPELYTSLDGPGDYRAQAYRWIPVRSRPDFMIARANEITEGLVRWLHESKLINRWIVAGVNTSNREQVEQWGFTKLLVD